MNTINELIERAHSQAKLMGWWDEKRNTGELLMLIVSECGEALEAHRSGKRCRGINAIGWPEQLSDKTRWPDGSEFTGSELFKAHVKDTFEDELADIVIRIADLLGSKESLTKWVDDCDAENYDGPEGSFNVGEQLFEVTQSIAHCGYGHRLSDDYRVGEDLQSAMMQCFTIAQYMNIDLWKHIDLKLKYNLTRPYRHAKLY